MASCPEDLLTNKQPPTFFAGTMKLIQANPPLGPVGRIELRASPSYNLAASLPESHLVPIAVDAVPLDTHYSHPWHLHSAIIHPTLSAQGNACMLGNSLGVDCVPKENFTL